MGESQSAGRHRWYRRLIAKKYDGSKSRKPGRPKTAVEIEELILQMAHDNTRWGYTRIRGALHNLGHEIGRNTVKRILLENGFDPAPLRAKGTSWKTFLKAHWGARQLLKSKSDPSVRSMLTDVEREFIGPLTNEHVL